MIRYIVLATILRDTNSYDYLKHDPLNNKEDYLLNEYSLCNRVLISRYLHSQYTYLQLGAYFLGKTLNFPILTAIFRLNNFFSDM